METVKQRQKCIATELTILVGMLTSAKQTDKSAGRDAFTVRDWSSRWWQTSKDDECYDGALVTLLDWLHRAKASAAVKLKVKRSMRLVFLRRKSLDIHASYEPCRSIRRVAIFLKHPGLDGETGKRGRNTAYKFLLLSQFLYPVSDISRNGKLTLAHPRHHCIIKE